MTRWLSSPATPLLHLCYIFATPLLHPWCIIQELEPGSERSRGGRAVQFVSTKSQLSPKRFVTLSLVDKARKRFSRPPISTFGCKSNDFIWSHIGGMLIHIKCFKTNHTVDTTINSKYVNLRPPPVCEGFHTRGQLVRARLAFFPNWKQEPCCSPPGPATSSVHNGQRQSTNLSTWVVSVRSLGL